MRGLASPLQLGLSSCEKAQPHRTAPHARTHTLHECCALPLGAAAATRPLQARPAHMLAMYHLRAPHPTPPHPDLPALHTHTHTFLHPLLPGRTALALLEVYAEPLSATGDVLDALDQVGGRARPLAHQRAARKLEAAYVSLGDWLAAKARVVPPPEPAEPSQGRRACRALAAASPCVHVACMPLVRAIAALPSPQSAAKATGHVRVYQCLRRHLCTGWVGGDTSPRPNSTLRPVPLVPSCLNPPPPPPPLGPAPPHAWAHRTIQIQSLARITFDSARLMAVASSPSLEGVTDLRLATLRAEYREVRRSGNSRRKGGVLGIPGEREGGGWGAGRWEVGWGGRGRLTARARGGSYTLPLSPRRCPPQPAARPALPCPPPTRTPAPPYRPTRTHR